MGSLAPTILAHAALGSVLGAFVWAVGIGWQELIRPRASLLAYPLGVLAVALAAWLGLVSPWLAIVSLVLVGPAVLGLRGIPIAAVARAAPFGIALGAALGALLHGPTRDDASHAYGDLLVYAAKLVSARESVLPFRDLLVDGESNTYVEAATTFLGAALPGVDPILFHAASMPAFLVTALAVGFGRRGLRSTAATVAVLAPLAAAVVAYPTWITESPPVALALPLAFSVYDLATELLDPWDVTLATVLVGLAFALTKGFGVVPLAVASMFAYARLRGRVSPRVVAMSAAPIAFVALAGVAFFVATSGWLTDVLDTKFLPADAFDGAREQLDRRDTQAAAPTFLVVGELLLGAALVLARAWRATAFLAAAVLGNWFVAGHGLDVTVAIAVTVAFVALAEQPAFLRRRLPLVVAAGGALALSVVFRDISGVRAGVVFAVLLAAGVLAAVAPIRAYAPLVAAGVAALALATTGLTSAPPTLAREHYDIWRAVRDRVPDDAVVFTTETGGIVSGEQGWNYYPGVAGRQVYVAGWSSSPLLVDRASRERRLRTNREVLTRRLAPRSAAPGHSSYYAVVRLPARPQADFRLVHANDRFALYEIP